jgi:hypothetical protein
VLLPDKNVRERLLHSSASLFRGWRRRPGCHNSAGRSDPREGPFARAGSGPSNLRPPRVPGCVVSGMGRHEPAKFEAGESTLRPLQHLVRPLTEILGANGVDARQLGDSALAMPVRRQHLQDLNLLGGETAGQTGTFGFDAFVQSRQGGDCDVANPHNRVSGLLRRDDRPWWGELPTGASGCHRVARRRPSLRSPVAQPSAGVLPARPRRRLVTRWRVRRPGLFFWSCHRS